jgi:hypothetical protein
VCAPRFDEGRRAIVRCQPKQPDCFVFLVLHQRQFTTVELICRTGGPSSKTPVFLGFARFGFAFHSNFTLVILKVFKRTDALKAWLAAAEITRGPIFRSIFKGGRVSANRLSDRSVAEIVKAYAGRIGVDPSSVSAHSLRAGFLTSAAQCGASVFKLMDVSRHKSIDTLSVYVRDVGIFKNHAGTGLL